MRIFLFLVGLIELLDYAHGGGWIASLLQPWQTHGCNRLTQIITSDPLLAGMFLLPMLSHQQAADYFRLDLIARMTHIVASRFWRDVLAYFVTPFVAMLAVYSLISMLRRWTSPHPFPYGFHFLLLVTTLFLLRFALRNLPHYEEMHDVDENSHLAVSTMKNASLITTGPRTFLIIFGRLVGDRPQIFTEPSVYWKASKSEALAFVRGGAVAQNIILSVPLDSLGIVVKADVQVTRYPDRILPMELESCHNLPDHAAVQKAVERAAWTSLMKRLRTDPSITALDRMVDELFDALDKTVEYTPEDVLARSRDAKNIRKRMQREKTRLCTALQEEALQEDETCTIMGHVYVVRFTVDEIGIQAELADSLEEHKNEMHKMIDQSKSDQIAAYKAGGDFFSAIDAIGFSSVFIDKTMARILRGMSSCGAAPESPELDENLDDNGLYNYMNRRDARDK